MTATNGVVESVTDEEISAAKAVIDHCGVGCEPASAASVAGVRALVARGEIRRDERVVAVLTGNLLKDPSGGVKVEESSPLTPDEALSLLGRVVSR
jgi:threonine synthase